MWTTMSPKHNDILNINAEYNWFLCLGTECYGFCASAGGSNYTGRKMPMQPPRGRYKNVCDVPVTSFTYYCSIEDKQITWKNASTCISRTNRKKIENFCQSIIFSRPKARNMKNWSAKFQPVNSRPGMTTAPSYPFTNDTRSLWYAQVFLGKKHRRVRHVPCTRSTTTPPKLDSGNPTCVVVLRRRRRRKGSIAKKCCSRC